MRAGHHVNGGVCGRNLPAIIILVAACIGLLPFHLSAQNIGKIVQDPDEFTWEDVLPQAELQFLLDLKSANPHWDWSPDMSHKSHSWPLLNNVIIPEALLLTDVYDDGWWLGFKLTAAARITRLQLYDLNLSGALPASIGNLTQLTSLWLDHNDLTGNIPSSIRNLTQLETLSLYNNQLTGTIPSSIGALTQLKDFALFWNELSGEVPVEIGNLTQLVSLRLEGNQLSGSIPESIGNLTQLTTLSLYWNELSGEVPAAIGNLTQLESIDLRGNYLDGVFPSTIWNLPNLVRLDLSGNQFNEQSFANMGSSQSLEVLNLSWNQIDGSLPAGIGSLPGLQHLSIAGNRLNGSLPSWVLTLRNLSELDIRFNDYRAQLPRSPWLRMMEDLQENGVAVWAEHQFWRRIAKVIIAQGVVQVREMRDEGYVVRYVMEGDWMYENDEIATGAESFCKLLIVDKSTANIGPNSKMKVELFPKEEPGIIDLIKGTIRRYLTEDYMALPDSVKTKLYIKTRGGGTGVRGTDVEVTYSESDDHAYMDITLYSGIIDYIDLISGDVVTLVDTGAISRSYQLTPEVGLLLDYLAAQYPDPEHAAIFSVAHDDHLPNLAKLAFNLDLHGYDKTRLAVGSGQTKGLPITQMQDASPEAKRFSMTYLRRKDLGITYTPVYTTNLLDDWTSFPAPVAVTVLDEVWDEVVVEVDVSQPVGTFFTAMRIGLPVSELGDD